MITKVGKLEWIDLSLQVANQSILTSKLVTQAVGSDDLDPRSETWCFVIWGLLNIIMRNKKKNWVMKLIMDLVLSKPKLN